MTLLAPCLLRRAAIALLLLPGVADAQGASISGVVRDSLARIPLGGAMVQLDSTDSLAPGGRTTTADAMGRYTLADVPDGRYLIGFHHPVLDSLGVEAPLRDVHVTGSRPVRADLATPSPARLRAAICGARPATDSGGVVVGVVREASERAPVSGAIVAGEWMEITFRTDGVLRRVPRVAATTGENGWFAICNVPLGGTISMIASKGVDSTDRLDVQVPLHGFVRRELYLGASRTLLVPDTAPRADTTLSRPRRMHAGTGRLTGTVTTARGEPLPTAQVGIVEGPQARTNQRGEWALTEVPLGTRVLEVRAVGYYPERRAVDVVGDAPPVRVALSTLKAMLDTVRITARRLYDRDRNGFQERSRTGPGRYLTEDDVAVRHALVTSQLFRMIPGMRVETDGAETHVRMRGPFGDCAPTFVLDGMPMQGLNASDIDDWISPREIAAMEIYVGATVPPQFQVGMSGCGAVVVWSKPRLRDPTR